MNNCWKKQTYPELQNKLLHTISHSIEVYEEPVLRKRKSVKIEVGDENRNLFQSLYCNAPRRYINNIPKKENKLFTDRVRSTMGRLCFDTCLSVCLFTEGVPQSGPAGWYLTLGTPHQTWLGVPLPGVPHLGYPLSDLAGGVPHSYQGVPQPGLMGGTPTGVLPAREWVPPPSRGTPLQDNRWSTWYAAVGMPLAFTQEDFLVFLLLQKQSVTKITVGIIQ